MRESNQEAAVNNCMKYYKTILIKLNKINANNALAGIVKIHAQTMLLAVFHLTALILELIPTPVIEPATA